MTRKLKFTDAELRNVLIDSNINILNSIKNELGDAINDPDTPTSALGEFKFTTGLLDNVIGGLNDAKGPDA